MTKIAPDIYRVTLYGHVGQDLTIRVELPAQGNQSHWDLPRLIRDKSSEVEQRFFFFVLPKKETKPSPKPIFDIICICRMNRCQLLRISKQVVQLA